MTRINIEIQFCLSYHVHFCQKIFSQHELYSVNQYYLLFQVSREVSFSTRPLCNNCGMHQPYLRCCSFVLMYKGTISYFLKCSGIFLNTHTHTHIYIVIIIHYIKHKNLTRNNFNSVLLYFTCSSISLSMHTLHKNTASFKCQ